MLVAEATQRLEPIERALDLGHVHLAPGDDVATRRRAERGEVATKNLGARLQWVVLLRLLDRDESAFGPAVPESRLVMVKDVRADARSAPCTTSTQARETMLALDHLESLCGGHRACRCELAHRGCEQDCVGHLVVVVRLAQRCT